METEVLLIRHGETDWNRQHLFQGQEDISLNQAGLIQANKLANFFLNWQDHKYHAIYSSDLARAMETAKPLAKKLNLEISLKSGLRELHFGDWQGYSFLDIKEKHPTTFKRWQDDPFAVSPPQGEELEDFFKRITETMRSLIAKHQGERIIIITHGGVIRAWLTHLFAMPKEKFWRLEVDNTSLSRVKLYDEQPIFSLLNFKAHLEMELS